MAFQTSYPNVLTQYHIDHTQSMSYMRLLTLGAYPTGHNAIPYAALMDALGIAEEDADDANVHGGSEVEAWVVKAITAKIIDAKIDQLGKTVVISRSSLQRGFHTQDWSNMLTTVVSYKATVVKLLDTIRHAKSRQAPPNAAAK